MRVNFAAYWFRRGQIGLLTNIKSGKLNFSTINGGEERHVQRVCGTDQGNRPRGRQSG